jgi:hypothetical protein
MVPLATTPRLLKRVALRLDLAAIFDSFRWFTGVALGVYAVALLVSRCTGYGSAYFSSWTLAMMPGLGLLLGLLFHRRPTTLDAARAVDTFGGTKDLFLTAALLERAAGEYQPLVAQSAEETAPRIPPIKVVPFAFEKPLAQLAGGLLTLALAVNYFPQFDPFGEVAAARKLTDKKQALADSREATVARKAQLKTAEEPEEGEASEEVKQAIEGLKASLNKMKPLEKTANARALAAQQKQLGEQWRQLANDKLKELFRRSAEEQTLGSAVNREKMQKWTQEMQEGSAASLQKELDAALDDLQRLMQTQDPVEKSQIEQSIRKRLKELDQFAKDRVDSKPLNAALQRAMKQLEMSKMEGLDPQEASEALRESMELAKQELQEVAQQVTDLEKLEEALKMVQMAKELNQREKLDGEETEGFSELGDYEEYYQQLAEELGLPPENQVAMAQGQGSDGQGQAGEGEGEGDGEGEGEGEGEGQGEGQGKGKGKGKKGKGKGQGQGEGEGGGEGDEAGDGDSEGDSDSEGDGSGLGGRGRGRGGQAPEDDSIETGFRTELSRSPITKGKTLMTMKGKGLGEKGDDKARFQEILKQGEQGLQEAIEQEQVPPGYVDGIKTYFGNRGKSTKAPAEPAPAQPTSPKSPQP